MHSAPRTISTSTSEVKTHEIDSTGDLHIDAEGDILISAKNGHVRINDEPSAPLKTIFDFDIDETSLTIHDDTTVADNFSITVAANGATTLATVDSDGAVGHLTLDADGDIVLDPQTGVTKFQLAGDADDLCTLTVAANGATTIATADSDGALGHLTLDVDGNIDMNSQGAIQIDGKADSNLTVTGSNKDLDIAVAGGSTQELRIASAGTGANAIQLNTTAGGITLDAHTDITLDANGGDVFLKDNTTAFGSLTNNSGNLIIKSGTTTAATFTGANVAFAGSMIIDYGSLTTSVPSEAGKLYKNGSNQVFISPGGG